MDQHARSQALSNTSSSHLQFSTLSKCFTEHTTFTSPLIRSAIVNCVLRETDYFATTTYISTSLAIKLVLMKKTFLVV